MVCRQLVVIVALSRLGIGVHDGGREPRNLVQEPVLRLLGDAMCVNG